MTTSTSLILKLEISVDFFFFNFYIIFICCRALKVQESILLIQYSLSIDGLQDERHDKKLCLDEGEHKLLLN